MRKLKLWINALLVLAVALVVRWYRLGAESPGFEEVTSLLSAGAGWRAYLQSPHPDLNQPVWLLFAGPVAMLGGKLMALRWLSAALGALACLASYLVGRRLFGDRGALMAGMLLALNPLHVFYSQEGQHAALLTVVVVVAFYYMVRSGETGKARDWIPFDLLAVTLLHLDRNAVFLVAAFLLVHIARILFFRDDTDQRRRRKRREFGIVAYNYLLITAVSLPWLVIMLPAKVPWLVEQPQWRQLMEVYWRFLPLGPSGVPHIALLAGVALAYVLLLPPMLKAARKPDFRIFALFAVPAVTPPALFAYSQFGPPRLEPASAAILLVPLFALAGAQLVSRCNLGIRTAVFLLIVLVSGYMLARQAHTREKPPWTALAEQARQYAKPGDVVVYWPDFTADMGRYQFGDTLQSVTATDFFTKWAEPPADSEFLFALSQYPMPGSHANTFPGALRQFSDSKVLWGDRMNQLIRARKLQAAGLALWYQDPKSLNVVDTPSSRTQFIFTPAHDAFKVEGKFHYKEPNLIYDYADGRRAVWTGAEHVELNLPVMLAPGNYVLKVHCAPDFHDGESGRHFDRTVNLDVRVGDYQRKAPVSAETTLQRSFSTEAEVRNLKVHFTASPLLDLGGSRRTRLGIKIYSIAIDQEDEPSAL
jgi:4-amino-4-deoxy-L-arabinose transferase-like glycosyltransferase